MASEPNQKPALQMLANECTRTESVGEGSNI